MNQRIRPEEWVTNYADDLYNYALYRVNNDDAALDLVQETFLAALKSASSFRGEASEKTWLISILKRKIIDHYRKASNRLEISADEQTMFPFYGHFFNEDDESRPGHWKKDSAPAEWHEADARINTKEFFLALNMCLSLLPQRWSAVVSMRLFEEKEAEKICKEMNITPSNYWVIMHRARLQLRECLEKNWFKNS